EVLGPDVVVVGEARLRPRLEVLLAALERLAQLQQALLLLARVLLDRLVDLGAQLVEVGGARLVVDPRHDRRGEVEDLLELLGRHVEQVADAARHALEEPDVAHGGGQVDVAHALAAHLLARDLHAAALADDALVPDALVLAAVALPVLGRTEDALAEQAVALRLERPVVDRLRLRYLAGRPITDLLARRETDSDCVEVVDVDHVLSLSFSLPSLPARPRRAPSLRLLRRRRPARPRGRRATRPPGASARRFRPHAPGPPRPPGRSARAPQRGASRATGRSRAPRLPAGARRPPRAPRPHAPRPRGRSRRARGTASPC